MARELRWTTERWALCRLGGAIRQKDRTMSKDRSSNGGQGRAAGELATPTDLSENGVKSIAAALNGLVADAFALYLKTKNFHWHMSGPHFRDYHLLLDEHADQIEGAIDPLAERVRKLGQTTIRSIGHIAKLQTVKDNDETFVSPGAMLQELEDDNRAMVVAMRKAHELCDDNHDAATAGLLETYIDETERRVWFLFEARRGADDSGH
jgi:starvation-inducible DNA-binding protein